MREVPVETQHMLCDSGESASEEAVIRSRETLREDRIQRYVVSIPLSAICTTVERKTNYRSKRIVWKFDQLRGSFTGPGIQGKSIGDRQPFDTMVEQACFWCFSYVRSKA
ncbi:hypothetical protein PM082_002368 [Marasmius tenuissimus]|nr:hypothetical protein PM082_002368 [Marasmius tenuissimus]